MSIRGILCRHRSQARVSEWRSRELGGVPPPGTSLSAGLTGLASMDTAAGHHLLGKEGKLKIQFQPLVGRGKRHGAGHRLAKKSLGERNVRLPDLFLHQGEQTQNLASPMQGGALTNHSGYLSVLTMSQELG